MVFRTIFIASVLYALLAAGICAWVYSDAFTTTLADDRDAGRVRLSEATSRLRGQLDVYRALVNVTAKDPKMPLALAEPLQKEVGSDLSLLSLTYGAWKIDLLNRQGSVIATSDPKSAKAEYSEPLIRAALNGRLGYTIVRHEARRLIQFSRGVPGPNATVLGVVVVSADLAALEFEWPVTPEPVIFFDNRGLSMSANRPELLLRSTAGDQDGAKFPLQSAVKKYETILWDYLPVGGTSREVQTLTVQIPQLQMTGKILLDTEQARAFALLRLGLAATLLLAGILVGAIFLQQRRKIALEARHSATLEHRVEERTAELRAAQNELVEAANLAALGRLSAGISHELNQPLAAILNFAENGRRLIKKSRTPEAADNLSRIADQVRRITRIIGNLRAFARQEHAPSERIDLAQVTKRAMDMVRGELEASGVTVVTTVPPEPIYVMAGKVRLEQVVLNLLSNAVDAMQGAHKKILTIALEDPGEQVRLSVRDTGTGIKEPERVFEPFYTTKQLGSSKGLGMGLALSFGLVTHFGGQLTCQNTEDGAEFVMLLPIHREE